MRRILLTVSRRDTQQHDESSRDLADDAPAHAHLRPADALNNCPHSCVIYIEGCDTRKPKAFVVAEGRRVL